MHQLDEQQFWTRYFQSKLFNRNRTTNRAAVNTIKDDKIFDLYLGEEDDSVYFLCVTFAQAHVVLPQTSSRKISKWIIFTVYSISPLPNRISMRSASFLPLPGLTNEESRSRIKRNTRCEQGDNELLSH